MPYIHATDRPLLWAVTQSNAVLASGLTEVGGLTITGEDKALVSDADENAFLGAVAGSAGDYNPLPDVGEFVEAGIYGWQGGLVVVRQPHTRQHNPDDPGVGALYGIYRPGVDVWEWVAGEVLQVGARRSYEGVVYELYRDIGANNWSPPPQVAAHWRVVVETPGGWAAGVAYKVGDVVTYNGHTWRCDQAHTSIALWYPGAPGVFLWTRLD
jgi:hypothetical protein